MTTPITKFRVTTDNVIQYLTLSGEWKNINYEILGTYLSLLTTDEVAAIKAASSPSSTNAVATIADLQLTSDEVGAINGASTPSASNVFITADDIQSSDTIASTTIDWAAANHFTKTLSTNTELFDINLPANPLVKHITLTIQSTAAETLTLPSYWKVISGTYDTSGVPNLLEVFCENDASDTQVDTITLSGTNGVAIVSAAGGLDKTVYFDSDLSTSAAQFVIDHASDYLAQKIVVTSDGDDLVFTSQYSGYGFTNPTISNTAGDLDGSVVNTQSNGTGTAQVDTVTISGTDGKVTIESAGGLTKTVLFDSDLTTTTGNFVTNYAADYAAQGITVTSSVDDIIFTATEAGTAFVNPTKTQIVGDLDGTEVATQANVAAVAQVDTITLTGTRGAAIINGPSGLVNSVVFNSSLTQTATDFVTNQAADYAAIGVTVTSSTADIIFTASSAGTSFTSPTITNDYGDLDGSVVNTQANVIAVAQVDTVTLDTGTDGKASITGAGGLTKYLVFDTDYETTAANFVTDYAADYDAQDITLTSIGDDLIFTAKVAGTGFTNAVITNVPWDLDASVANTQVNVAKVAQIDTVTLDTGTAGAASITLAGGLTKEVVFDADYATSAALFATRYASDYLAQDILLTNSGDDIIFTARIAGTAFTSPAIANVASTLTGSVANTTVNVEPQVWVKINKEA